MNEIRRIVTGHDANGKAVFTEVGPLPTVVPLAAIPGTVFHEIWSTQETPARVGDGLDQTLGPLVLSPPRHGTHIRIVDIPPDTEECLRHGAARMVDAFAQIGEAEASTVQAASPHPLMHRTESIDYGVVLEGSMTLVLEDSETELAAGDIVIQGGTNHAWANRSGARCRMLSCWSTCCTKPVRRAHGARRPCARKLHAVLRRPRRAHRPEGTHRWQDRHRVWPDRSHARPDGCARRQRRADRVRGAGRAAARQR